ncbi:MAG: hypothetical protein ACRDPY_27265 [Streptosporangiaceae bacterium]
MRHPRLVLAAAAIVIAAVLAAGYLTAGATGLVDAAAVAALGVLLVARSTVRGEKPRSVRPKKSWPNPRRRPAVRVADFPAYSRIFSDLEWAQMSRRHYEHALRPMLARLAATLDHGRPVPAELTRSPSGEVDGPGVDPATLERVVATLENRSR